MAFAKFGRPPDIYLTESAVSNFFELKKILALISSLEIFGLMAFKAAASPAIYGADWLVPFLISYPFTEKKSGSSF